MNPVVVPYTLRRRAALPANALLLLDAPGRTLLQEFARLRLATTPPIYRLASGLLLCLPEASTVPSPGAIRLRALAPNLFIPVDADLSPALLADEAAGLARDRGLVFLPGGRIEAFDPERTLSLARLVSAPPSQSAPWTPLPVLPGRPERLVIRVDRPDESAETLLAPGGDSIGVESPRPAGAGPITTVAGHAAAAVGRGLAGLGGLLALPGLTALGGWLLRGAAAIAPRLTESLLGKQEAALRELLRLFQLGDLERALRRALPLNSPGGRGAEIAGDARLPFHNLFYSLGKLLGGGHDRASLWLGGGDVQAQLAAEYRRAAEAAARRGDHRRAAFIYAKLLHDFRSAAAVLERGGLHHDAAILYLERVNDPLAAARAFELAGEIDRAVGIYRDRGEHALAGDLLKRAGDDEAALVEYQLAAARLVAAFDHHGAGDLLLRRAHRRDLALQCFREGWATRPSGTEQSCLRRLAALHADEPSPRNLLTLVGEADEFLAQMSNPISAGEFYNDLARLAELPVRAGERDELRDRALAGLALQLRRRSTQVSSPGTVVSSLLGRSGAWPAAAVRDAEFAFRAAVRGREAPRMDRAPDRNGISVARGDLTAVCAAARSGRLFLGFADGRIVEFDPIDSSSRVVAPGLMTGARPLQGADNIILSLATDALGEQLLAAGWRPGGACVFCWLRTDAGLFQQRAVYESNADLGWLTPLTARGSEKSVGFWDGAQMSILEVPSLVARDVAPIPEPHAALCAAVPFNGFAACLRLVGNDVHYYDAEPPLNLGWQPAQPAGMSCLSPPLACLRERSGAVELAAVAGHAVHWARFAFDHAACKHVMEHNLATGTDTGPYLAATLIGPGRIAGVARDGVHWLRPSAAGGLSCWLRTEAALDGAVACFPSPMTGELLVVTCGGDEVCVVRVPLSL